MSGTQSTSSQAQGSTGTQPAPRTEASEEYDIFMWVDPNSTRPTDEVDLFCKINFRDRMVDHSREPFFRDWSNQIHIRIPALMCVRYVAYARDGQDILDKEIKDFMRYSYRKQIGTHAFLTHTKGSNIAPVGYQKTVENMDMNYDCMFPRWAKIASIYPCLRQRALDKKRFEMVFGLCFVPQQTEGRMRTWGRYHCTDVKNMYSFDITAAMFDRDNKDAANPGDHYANTQLFPEVKPNPVGSAVNNDEQWSVAFYVCEGARVWLTDHRQLDLVNKNQTRHISTYDHHCRSLCQQGSVIIVRGVCKYGIGLYQPSKSSVGKGGANVSAVGNANVKPKFGEDLLSHYFDEFCSSDVVKPHVDGNKLDRTEEVTDGSRVISGMQLSQLKDKVIFLGANESQYNSACWDISIARDDEKLIDHSVLIHGSDGAVIVDIAPWRTGFELIYWRQRYERLHKSVVIGFNALDFDENMKFMVPSDDYYLKRIIGIESTVRNGDIPICNQLEVYVPRTNRKWLTPNNDDHFLSKDDIDVRRYIASHQDCQHNLLLRNIEVRHEVPNYQTYLNSDDTNRLPPLPLYPPYMLVKEPKEYIYLQDKMDKMVSVDGGYFKILWKSRLVPTTMDPNQMFKLSRVSIDAPYWKYLGTNDPAQYNNYRLGSDYFRYYKVYDQGQQVQKVETFCLDQVDAPTGRGISLGSSSGHKNGESSGQSSESSEDNSKSPDQVDATTGRGRGRGISSGSSSDSNSRQKNGESSGQSSGQSKSSEDDSKSPSKHSKTESSDSKKDSMDTTGSGHKRSQSSPDRSDQKQKSGETSGESPRQSSKTSSKEDPKSPSKILKT